MKQHPSPRALFDDYLGCFGNFSLHDVVCCRHCALALRCAIEMEHNQRMAIMDDMFYRENMELKLQ